jgi:hypothetical protein
MHLLCNPLISPTKLLTKVFFATAVCRLPFVRDICNFCAVSAVESAIFLQAGGSVIFCDSLALIWLHHAASTPAKTHLATAQPRISWYAWNVRSVYPGESQAILATFSNLLFDIIAIFRLIQASTV